MQKLLRVAGGCTFSPNLRYTSINTNSQMDQMVVELQYNLLQEHENKFLNKSHNDCTSVWQRQCLCVLCKAA